MYKILVVDDDSDTRLLLGKMLKHAGYTVVEAEDGDEVVPAALSYEPDIVLMDIVMPRMDGFKALVSLKQDPRIRHIPVIVVTGRNHPDDLKTARSLGAHNFINKPWAHGEVELRVQWAITSVERLRKRAEEQQRLAG